MVRQGSFRMGVLFGDALDWVWWGVMITLHVGSGDGETERWGCGANFGRVSGVEMLRL